MAPNVYSHLTLKKLGCNASVQLLFCSQHVIDMAMRILLRETPGKNLRHFFILFSSPLNFNILLTLKPYDFFGSDKFESNSHSLDEHCIMATVRRRVNGLCYICVVFYPLQSLTNSSLPKHDLTPKFYFWLFL